MLLHTSGTQSWSSRKSSLTHAVVALGSRTSYGLVVLNSSNAVTHAGVRGGGTIPGALGGHLAIRPTVHGARRRSSSSSFSVIPLFPNSFYVSVQL